MPLRGGRRRCFSVLSFDQEQTHMVSDNAPEAQYISPLPHTAATLTPSHSDPPQHKNCGHCGGIRIRYGLTRRLLGRRRKTGHQVKSANNGPNLMATAYARNNSRKSISTTS